MRKRQHWTEQWKRFLYEGVSNQVVNIGQLERIFDYFHVSTQKLSDSDSFTFTPRVPRFPYEDDQGNVIEDDFTKRISVAKNIDDALTSIEGTFKPSDWIFLYAGVGNPDVEAKQEDCPETENMEYDTTFRMSTWLGDKLESGEIKAPANASVRKWLDQSPGNRGKLAPSGLPNYLRHEFEHCVPDADETRENWLVSPRELVYVGELNPKEKIVLLSNEGLSLAKKAKLRLQDY